MKKLFSVSFLCVLMLFVQGCGISKSYMYEQNIPKNENKDIEISLTPINPSMIAGYSAFILKINNKTNNDIELDWNKTYFIDNGKTNGGFMFEGIVFKDRNNPKVSDIIFANGQFSKVIYPNNYVVFSTTGSYSNWEHNGFGVGEFGIYLTYKIDNKEIKEKAFVKVREK